MTREEHEKKRQEAYKLGLHAEQIAVDYLIAQGYSIKERRWKPFSGKGEIDIIAAIDNIIVFIEVKARTESIYEALNAVDDRKQRFIAKGADKYMQTIPMLMEYRYDIIGVCFTSGEYTVTHIPDAFISPLFTR